MIGPIPKTVGAAAAANRSLTSLNSVLFWALRNISGMSLATHFKMADRPWQQPGTRTISPVWWAVTGFKEQEALNLLAPADATRRYHGQRSLLMLAAEKTALRVIGAIARVGR